MYGATECGLEAEALILIKLMDRWVARKRVIEGFSLVGIVVRWFH